MTEPMRVLLPVSAGNEEIEFTAIFDVLRRGDLDVVIAGIDGSIDPVRLQMGLRIIPDCTLEQASESQWDAIVMAGGIPGAMNLGDSTLLRDMLVSQHAAGRLIAAICLSPALVLQPAGVLDQSARATCNPKPIRMPDHAWPPDEFTSRLGDKFDPDARVCVDAEHNVITSQTPGTAIEFALAIVEAMRGSDEASRIRDYILV
ncbi:MAG: DJ-1 family protein [Phycisphaerae bacterium]|nr:DJ-1 family protein [Phycisphaerae bacterium]|tara:strand:- start:2790 stop:3398 length:609 start_codon:yes stop_codon:yes gene_type:complete